MRACVVVPQTISHLYHIENAVLSRSDFNGGFCSPISPVHSNTQRVEIDPALYAHVLHLLGNNPTRFTSDLRFYIATVRTFFDGQPQAQLISVPNGADADFKKRLSEDMGVALASTFMTKAFDIRWESISQIPANSKLSKKRPDFQSFRRGDNVKPYIFEAKGTTLLSSVEKTTSNALQQAKGYPVAAHAKLVLTSYLSADSRYFPSATFVIDPPGPSSEFIDSDISTLMHFEKILQFSGLLKTSVRYISLLSKLIKDGKIRITSIQEFPYRLRLEAQALRETYEEESLNIQSLSTDNRVFIGQRYEIDDATLFFGADKERIDNGINFASPESQYEQRQIIGEASLRSHLDDGTLFDMQL